MNIVLGSLMIFFGTLLAAGLVALGHPGPDSVDLGPWLQPAAAQWHAATHTWQPAPLRHLVEQLVAR